VFAGVEDGQLINMALHVGKAVCQAQEGGWLAVTDRRLIRLSRVRLVSLLVVGFRLNQVSLVSLLGSVC